MTFPSEDRYLSATALHEAAAVLLAVAVLLDRVEGAFADDACVDAAHLRDLAGAISEWWPHPADRGPKRGWEDLLRLYVAHGLRNGRTESLQERDIDDVEK